MQQTNLEPGASELRNFGLIFGAFIAVIFGALLPFLFSGTYRSWPWMVGGFFALWALIHPLSLKPVFHLWIKIGNVLNYVNTRLILAIVFFGLFLPIGGGMRLFGWDAMKRKSRAEETSFRTASTKRPSSHLERPY